MHLLNPLSLTKRLVLLPLFLGLAIQVGVSQVLSIPQVAVTLPNHYQGWLFVIPVRDTVAWPCPRVQGRYPATEQGVAYIPEIITQGQFRVRLYENGEDLFPKAKYAGLVEQQKGQEQPLSFYRYLQFYLPAGNEREIAASDAYWREATRWIQLDQQRKAKFRALLQAGHIVFQ